MRFGERWYNERETEDEFFNRIISEEMIKAGAEEFSGRYDHESSREVAVKIYKAMHKAGWPPHIRMAGVRA